LPVPGKAEHRLTKKEKLHSRVHLRHNEPINQGAAAQERCPESRGRGPRGAGLAWRWGQVDNLAFSPAFQKTFPEEVQYGKGGD